MLRVKKKNILYISGGLNVGFVLEKLYNNKVGKLRIGMRTAKKHC